MEQTSHLTAEHLTMIRQNADWRRIFDVFQIERDPKRSREDDWWGKSPFKPDERTASFHINDRGWYCHSTGQGGGVIELVQRLHPEMNCYAAGRWLLEQGVSCIVDGVREAVEAVTPDRCDEEGLRESPPIRQDLRPSFVAKHPAFTDRGIPQQVLEDLGAGYLERPVRKDRKHDPMNRRLVFQIRGLREDEGGYMRPVVLGHIGRATREEQEQQDGKWWTYAGFKKSLEIYNIDRALLDDEAIAQTADTDHVLIVEGCFDVAKLRAAGICNVVATLGAHLSPEQITRLDLLSELLGFERFLVWYDRDQDGSGPHGQGAVQAVDLLSRRGYETEIFDWDRHFSSPQRPEVLIPAEITDPAEFSIEQLRWLRHEGIL